MGKHIGLKRSNFGDGSGCENRNPLTTCRFGKKTNGVSEQLVFTLPCLLSGARKF
jgi:hypothetical protein